MGFSVPSSGYILFQSGASTPVDIRAIGVIIEPDPDDNKSIQFRIPSASCPPGTTHDRIALYISSSGQIGIGHKNPTTALDIRDNLQNVEPSGSSKTQLLTLDSGSDIFIDRINGGTF